MTTTTTITDTSVTDTSTYARHLSSQFDTDLNQLAARIMTMGGAVEQQLANAAQALTHGLQTIDTCEQAERDINAMEREVDAESAYLIARRQPAAQDLRFVLSMLKVCNNLERMGDEAIKLSRTATSLTLLKHSPALGSQSIHRGLLAALSMAQQMTRASLDSLARLSVSDATAVLFSDVALDTAYRALIAQIVAGLQSSPDLAPAMVDVLFLIKAVERVGDHAKNIAESVIYIAEGEDVRHTNKTT
jgi:phosphate transport system protein